MKEKLEISFDEDLIQRIDELLDLLGFGSREEFVVSAVRRLVARYRSLSVAAR